MSVGKIVGENLRRIRESRDLTQDELERLSGVSQVTITSIETGKTSNPRKSNLGKLAKALQCDISEFYKEHEDNLNSKYVSPDADDITRKYIKALEDKGHLNDQLLEAQKELEGLKAQVRKLEQEVETHKKKS